MWYYGKRMDTFAYALNMMFVHAGIGKIPYLDCIAKRNFAMCCQGQPVGWFKPCITGEGAVQELNQHIFHDHQVVRCMEGIKLDKGGMRQMIRGGCVIGPLVQEPAIRHLKYKMYRGAEHYIVMSEDSRGRIEVSDPLGTPIWFVDDEECISMLQAPGVSIIWLDPAESDVYGEIDWYEVVRQGFEYHWRCARREESTEQFRYVEHYSGNSSAHLGLHMALNCYVLRLGEVVDLLNPVCGQMINVGEITELFREMYRIKYTQEVERLSDIDRTVWETLYEQFKISTINKSRKM
ncbi:hypothetical protein ACQRBN_04475 [Bariatricus sp. SGI.154]|uniref:hypothetical protein n=1 Tax=Bariatricus sp. SGI.154 TaxID=3420549 RepID=UPI003D035D40